MVFEDAHWIDPTSRELLGLTIDRVAGLPVLLVITFRPELQHSWSGQPHVTELALNRLGGRESTALVERLAGVADLSCEIVSEIVERTDGVPLFVEELTKAVLESSDRTAAVTASPSPALSIPATLHASLIARLDRLGPIAKDIGQIGSVVGRGFSYDLLEEVAQRPADELRSGLDRLIEAGLLFCRGVAPQASISLSMRWCRTPPTAPCCAREGGHCTRGSPRPCTINSRKPSTRNRSSWLITLRERAWSSRRSSFGTAPAHGACGGPLTPRRPPISTALSIYWEYCPRAGSATSANWNSRSRSPCR